MHQTIPLPYGLAGCAIAVIVGTFLGIVLRGVKARRQVERLNGELLKTQQQLAAATGTKEPTPRSPPPARWTGAEVAAVLGAIGTLCGALGTIYANYQGTELTQQKAQIAELSSIAGILRYTTVQWMTMLRQPAGFPNHKILAPWAIDGLDVNRDGKSDCRPAKVTLTYQGDGPAALHCEPGAVTIQLNQRSKLLLIGEVP